MIISDIANAVLFEPLSMDVNELLIISGYAAPSMLAWYIKKLEHEVRIPIKINILVGMTPSEGISATIHNEYLQLLQAPRPEYINEVSCNYLYRSPAVNSNLYIWCKDSNPVIAFTGSAIFSKLSFFGFARQSVMVQCDANESLRYYDDLVTRSVKADAHDTASLITIRSRPNAFDLENKHSTAADEFRMNGFSVVDLSLITKRTGKPGRKSGLNWGQRPGRDPNEAYIPVPAKVARSGFFPTDNEQFTVHTDDDHELILRVEQEKDKAITTPDNNSLLGEYFRNRLGLPNGAFVTRADLDRYGRTDVTFVDMQDGSYYMDFSVY